MKAEAADYSIAPETLRRAREDLGVICRKRADKLRPDAGSLKRQLDIVRDWDTATQRLALERDKELSTMVPTK